MGNSVSQRGLTFPAKEMVGAVSFVCFRHSNPRDAEKAGQTRAKSVHYGVPYRFTVARALCLVCAAAMSAGVERVVWVPTYM